MTLSTLIQDRGFGSEVSVAKGRPSNRCRIEKRGLNASHSKERREDESHTASRRDRLPGALPIPGPRRSIRGRTEFHTKRSPRSSSAKARKLDFMALINLHRLPAVRTETF